MDHAHRGESALTAGKPQEALVHYTAAIEASPNAATYYIKRSQANQRLQKFPEALSDAEVGVVLSVKRAKRELIAQGQYRRAVALYHLGQFANAQHAFALSKKYNEKDKSIGIWETKCQSALKGLEEDDENAKVTIVDVPDVEAPVPKKDAPAQIAEAAAISEAPFSNTISTSSTTVAAPATASQTPADKIRHDWYQSNTNVTISFMAKGIPAAQTTVDILPSSLSVSFPLATGATYDFSLDPLCGTIDPSGSTFKVLSTKLEINLKKSTPGQKWAALEGSATPSGPTISTAPQSTIASTTSPAYPTSSRSGPKNWDKIVSSYSKPTPSKPAPDTTKNSTEKDTKPEDDDLYVDDYDDEGDPANAFFKKLYAGADPDTRRAMMKSFQESGGTALSTNWGEVSKGKVEVHPPDGMEEKKWER